MKCPFCREEIKDEAVKCRYCGEYVKGQSRKRTTKHITISLNKAEIPSAAKKILIIDDEPNILLLVKTRLQMNGYKALIANNGEEGLLSARMNKPDLIIVDVMMPKMGGYEFVKTLKADDALKNIPVVVFSAKGAMKDLFLAEGVHDFLPKPYDPDELLKTVQKLTG